MAVSSYFCTKCRKPFPAANMVNIADYRYCVPCSKGVE